MNKSADELLVAAAVLPLAEKLRNAALKAAVAKAELQWRESPPLSSSMTNEERMALDQAEAAENKRTGDRQSFSEQWLRNHPIEEFAREALEQLERVADAISSQP